ncbi:hypothetical protein E8F20_27675 [Pseudomonas sp. BN415]|uniref:hypothetical protein n=1 Tax=Pseudomonas sp. BN415 TaxID=2567889 RepID=UPI002453F7B3|nr:hypothetical protein [Pseudomonas sp. BN415]MDH4585632.1 hypothetical protein [Pseudomonas sp. BN415]
MQQIQTMFFSASLVAFFCEEVHGARSVSAVHPDWVRPNVPVEVEPGDSIELQDGTIYTNTTEEPVTVQAPDWLATPTLIEVPNPSTKIPEDAVQVPAAEYRALLEGMSNGKVLASDAEGRPVLRDAPLPGIADLRALIDNRVAEVTANWTRFENEYLEREASARTYKNGGYQGVPAVWVKAFADAAYVFDPSNLEAAAAIYREATDLILAQADGLRAAQQQLGCLRMRKYELNRLEGQAAVDRCAEILAAVNALAAQMS